MARTATVRGPHHNAAQENRKTPRNSRRVSPTKYFEVIDGSEEKEDDEDDDSEATVDSTPDLIGHDEMDSTNDSDPDSSSSSDDEEDQDDDDEDTASEYETTKSSRKPTQLHIPKKLVLDRKTKRNQVDEQSDEQSEEQSDEEDSGSEFETGSELPLDTPIKRSRRPSVLDRDLDDMHVFMRSSNVNSNVNSNMNSALQSSDNDEDQEEHEHSFDLEAASGVGLEEDYILAFLNRELENDRDENVDEEDYADVMADDDYDDDADVEEEEEQMLLEEFRKNGQLDSTSNSNSSISPELNPADEKRVQEVSDSDSDNDSYNYIGNGNEHDDDVFSTIDGTYDDPKKAAYEFESDQSEVWVDDDFLESKPKHYNADKKVSSFAQEFDQSDEDDSYLWSYFFSSGSESSDDEDDVEEVVDGQYSKHNSISNHGIVTPVSRKKRSKSFNNNFNNNTNNGNNGGINYTDAFDQNGFEEDSGESTDEDLSIPPPSSRRAGTRATEVLSSSNMASRPPVLGTWVMSSERPFGIIDGLTTRTLSPPLNAVELAVNQSSGGNSGHGNRRRRNSSSTPGSSNKKRSRSQQRYSENQDSDLSELALEDFIYTSELDDDNDDMATSNPDDQSTPWINRISTDVPLSAFRNRGAQYNYAYPTVAHNKRLPLKNSRKPSSREVVMTPLNSAATKKRSRHRKSKRMLYEEPPSMKHEFQASDLIDELVDIGALSPLFQGI